ncbi:MAG: hypothetical protein ABIR24_08605, partial [Verrucomicrobiota bacterium]
ANWNRSDVKGIPTEPRKIGKLAKMASGSFRMAEWKSTTCVPASRLSIWHCEKPLEVIVETQMSDLNQ